MRIGIDISQTVYKTGVSNFVLQLIESMVKDDTTNTYILFASSLRQRSMFSKLKEKYKDQENVTFKIYPFPPMLLDIMWNILHMFPIEWFVGPLDIFVSSDWTQPPTVRAKKATILYDVIVYKYPQETAGKIVEVQKRRLNWVRKEVEKIICISESTKKDAEKLLGIRAPRLAVVYPGV